VPCVCVFPFSLGAVSPQKYVKKKAGANGSIARFEKLKDSWLKADNFSGWPARQRAELRSRQQEEEKKRQAARSSPSSSPSSSSKATVVKVEKGAAAKTDKRVKAEKSDAKTSRTGSPTTSRKASEKRGNILMSV